MNVITSLLVLLTTPNKNDITLEGSKWSRRTAKKREQIGKVLNNIQSPSFEINGIVAPSSFVSQLHIETLDGAPRIEWSLHHNLDPQGGGLLKADSPRAIRKRRQIEAFVHLIRSTLQCRDAPNSNSKPVIVDAGSGAGNLAIPLARLLDCNVLAIDVNDVALDRLKARDDSVTTLCADLASPTIALPSNAAMVCSLHACGAATDLAIQLATRHGLPFCVSPCCTAKSLTVRQGVSGSSSYGPSTSFQRSGSPLEMTYPRSNWLQSCLPTLDSIDYYSQIAKVADVGLGPQTPVSQREHQRLAKVIVELDRLAGVVEQHDYSVGIFRIQDHDDYGKSEIMVGMPPSVL